MRPASAPVVPGAPRSGRQRGRWPVSCWASSSERWRCRRVLPRARVRRRRLGARSRRPAGDDDPAARGRHAHRRRASRNAIPRLRRERQVQAGPRGLGVAIGLGVDDLDATYQYCRAAGSDITSEPSDEAWGDRVFECIDPFGYLWEFSQPIPGGEPSTASERLTTPGSATRQRESADAHWEWNPPPQSACRTARSSGSASSSRAKIRSAVRTDPTSGCVTNAFTAPAREPLTAASTAAARLP